MKVAILLAGSGVYDGSEIYEATLTQLYLDQADVAYQCIAPNISQAHVINHAQGDVAEGESRNVLVESARLCRGNILDLADAQVADYDALIVPGGFGVAKNLCDFAFKGAELSIVPEVKTFIQAFHQAGKVIGLECIAPVMTAAIFGAGTRCTIGQNPDIAAAVTATGAEHVPASVHDIVVDDAKKLVTTPAYNEATRIRDAAIGIEKLVNKVIELAKK